MRRRCLGLVVGLCAFCLATPLLADVIVLDGSDAVDWARTLTSYHWKDQDTILRPNGLLKFNLRDLPATAVVNSATLNFYTEASEPGSTIALGHVTDDSWSFLTTAPADLYNWPVAHGIARYGTGFVGWRSYDILRHIQEEQVSGDRFISFKWEDASFSYPPERIVSPSAFEFTRRPYIRIDYSLIIPVIGPPDVTVGPSDIRPSDATPTPNLPISVTITVTNNGAGDARNVVVNLLDGDPDAGGILVGSRTIPLVLGGGGRAATLIAWTPRAGAHRLYAVVDPANAIRELDENNNRDFNDVPVQAEYTGYFEGFERAAVAGSGTLTWVGGETGFGAWAADGDVPFDANIDLARQWQAVRTRTESYEGDTSVSLYLDGRSDDGTVWLERWVPVDPDSKCAVDLSFAFGIGADMATSPVYFIGLYDPEQETDFTRMELVGGWNVYEASQTVLTGSSTRIWVAVGLTVSWEIPVRHYLDAIKISVQQ